MSSRPSRVVPVERVETSAYQFPTDEPESDGALAWDSTTMVLVRAHAAGRTGIGYTYAGQSTATWASMQRAVRNLGKTSRRRAAGLVSRTTSNGWPEPGPVVRDCGTDRLVREW